MLRQTGLFAQLRGIYGWREEQERGRTIVLLDALITAVFNVFITGVFYTGFLSMYDIDLVGVGVITFIPPLASCFHMFSPMILERIKRRKWVLVASKIYFYAMYILAANVMPLLVTDPGARVVWFCVLLFLAYAVYTLFSDGFTPWFYNFYPAEQGKRAAFLSYNQMISAISSSLVMLVSGLIVSAAGRGQNTVILIFRYFAFVLVLVDVTLQAMAKEYPYPVRARRVRIREVFTLSRPCKKFMACLYLMFIWNYISNLNNGLWSYYLLNTVKYPYSTITTANAIYPVCLLLFSRWWRRLLARQSWIRTFALGVLLFVPTEIYFFFLSPVTKWMYFPGAMVQYFLNVGLNLSYANIFYMNLPRENAATHTSFQALFCNLCAFLGLMTGTLMCRWVGDFTWYIGSVPITAVQYTTLMRAACLLALGLVLMKKWRVFTPDSEIEAVELAMGSRMKKEGK